MSLARKALLVLAAATLALSVVKADGCKNNNGTACPQAFPCCHNGFCSNSKDACEKDCDVKASFNGKCERNTKPVPALPFGSFKIVGETGVAAQHIALVRPTKMLIIDKAEANVAKLPSGLSAYNAEYDLTTNKYRVLDVQTNTFCSGGGFLPNGTLISAGGAESRHSRSFMTSTGFQSLRMWNPCDDETCEWLENPEDPQWSMTGNRWYVSITTLPDGRLFVLGGSNESLAVNRYDTNNPTYELYPKPADYKPVYMDFLVDSLPNNLYPNVYPLPDGNLFIFANQKSMIFNLERNEVVKKLPDIPGGSRSYPLTGTVVLLPLDPAKNYAHEVLVCGGTQTRSRASRALDTCGRINLSDENPQWEMDTMPTGRLMSDGVIMADGKIMILNGCQRGYAGFYRGGEPVLTPLVYDPDAPLGQRFTNWTASNIPRMYHSVAMLLPDMSIFVAGSNENSEVRLEKSETVNFVTEYRVENFTPPYLSTDLARPEIKTAFPGLIKYAQKLEVTIDVKDTSLYEPEIVFWLGRRGFVTHSTHMSQRMTKLVANKVREAGTSITYTVAMPPNANLMPPGPHYFHVTNNGVPSMGIYTLLN
ncbi:hypothetical protein DFQ27_001224 [Actinomortierella ambigua]|uniref:Glyoxal oxidase n=1 Tax=Actinomortierella ambigua TaxID=1343610 RepID=A0A9P6UD36_9FUNG|nr:hypothetical protein DFQ27_001224 [Actinomortierella ambigua]